jgi:bifunctional DNase/RNase
MPVEMKVKGLIMDPVSDMPIIVLKKTDGDAMLPIWVGMFEANAIAQTLDNVISPRPQTHELICSILDTMHAHLRKVVITDLRDSTYYAMLHVERNGETLEIDARPSDAMVLALRTKAPIFVEEAVLEASAEEGDEADEAERLRKWLEGVDPEELGRYEM